MRERTETIIGLLVIFLLLFPLGYFVHASPRFPGSPAGGMVGLAALTAMFLTLLYPAAKRIAWVDRRLNPLADNSTWLAIHIYAGVLAPILGLIHAAHKFQSPVGVLLTTALLMVVITGFIGRFLLAQTAKALRGRKSELAILRSALVGQSTVSALEGPVKAAPSGWRRYFLETEDSSELTNSNDREMLSSALADVEYAVRTEEFTYRLFDRWRLFHLISGYFLFVLLFFHVAAALYYGLRWL